MDYYHLTPADLECELSSSAPSSTCASPPPPPPMPLTPSTGATIRDDPQAEEDDDDPNWFLSSHCGEWRPADTAFAARRPMPVNSAEGGTRAEGSNNALGRLLGNVASYVRSSSSDQEQGKQSADNGLASAEPSHNCHRRGEDPIAARICELFDEMQWQEEEREEQAAQSRNQQNSTRFRLRDAGFFKRRKQTVSAYLSDWTRWLRGDEIAFDGEGEYIDDDGYGGCAEQVALSNN